MEYKVLSNGYKIPDICFGTDIVDYKTTFAEKTKQNVKYIVKTFLGKNTQKYKRDKGIIECANHSIENGCIFFDTSRAYGGPFLSFRYIFYHKKRKKGRLLYLH